MSSFYGRCSPVGTLRNVGVMLLGALAWSGWEYLRATLLTGFGWNTLAISQVNNLALIQVADVGGVYLVSFVVMAMNLGIALTVLRYVEARGGKRFRSRLVHAELLTGILLVALSVSYGITRIKEKPPAKPLKVALIQTNIPQDAKWTIQFIDHIFEALDTYTRLVADPERTDLIVWPETAVPDYVRSSRASYDLVYHLATNGVPILVGSMDTRPGDDGKPKYYNSSFLFGPDGHVMELYDKRHLVMFGEYVPLARWFPFLKALTPIEASFDAGERPTVFSLGDKADFATLICFEDVLPELSREVVRLGARMLVNQTNDAWFDPLSGSRQHMMHCVFRCIENRVPAVRSANTGVTCAINRFGMVHEVLRGERQDDYRVAGFKLTEVQIPTEPFRLTFYTRYGDVFGLFAAFVAVGTLVGVFLNGRLPKPSRGRVQTGAAGSRMSSVQKRMRGTV